ncbi:MAG: hypothetical protein IKU07_09290 [Oscillospiraceae bacterium]|nr:hypothetical protein [Oscillospiraceae bacterium]
MSLNQSLIMAQEEWNEAVLFPHVTEHENHMLSRPFYFGVSPEYVESPKRIMIIGQEARAYGSYHDDWPMPDIQQWGIDYLRRQLWNIRPTEFKYNRSAFWRFFRTFAKSGYVPCWNNIDKVHLQKGNESTIRLSYDLKKVFCRTYGEDGKSLLQREIAIARPDAVIFITGPKYHVSMTESLGMSEGGLNHTRPNSEAFCKNITKEVSLGIPVFWSYHPTYLNRCHKLADCVQTIIEEIEKV